MGMVTAPHARLCSQSIAQWLLSWCTELKFEPGKRLGRNLTYLVRSKWPDLLESLNGFFFEERGDCLKGMLEEVGDTGKNGFKTEIHFKRQLANSFCLQSCNCLLC